MTAHLLAVLLAQSAGFTHAAYVEGDVRLAFPESDPAFVERSRSAFGLRIDAAPAENVRAVLDGRVLWLGADASGRDLIRVDGDAAFVEVTKGWFRTRIGRQTVRWGSGLLFNPTSVVSPPDLEDPLRFALPLGNEMLEAQIALGPVRIEGLVVPRFRPALLPTISARDALRASGDPNAEAIADDESWTVTMEMDARAPDSRLANAQSAVRVSAQVLGVDAAVSYYEGRTPIPQVLTADLQVDFVAQTLDGDARLDYPRTHVAGLDLAAEALGFGLWAETAAVAPVPRDRTITVTSFGITQTRTETQFEEPYVRAAAGIDRMTSLNVYVALQYVRGFFDEFGADAQGDYAFAILERAFLRDTLRVRIVGGVAIEDGSTLLSPEVGWSPADAVTLSLGGYAGFGGDDTRFGRPLVGPPVVVTRARLSF